jgi:hypothetical protein
MEGPVLADIRLCGAFPGPLECLTSTVQACNTHDSLIRVAWCGDKFIGELLRDGITRPVRFLCRFLLSERAARTLGTASTRDDTGWKTTLPRKSLQITITTEENRPALLP